MMLRRMLASLLVLLLLGSLSQAYQELWDTPQGRERIFNALVNIFRDNYWDADYRDWSLWANDFRETALSAESRTDFDRTLGRMVSDLRDDHSRWIGRSLEPGQLDPGAGLGLGIQHSFLPGVGIVVERVFPETPAAQVGLRRGDVIARVNNVDVRQLTGSYEVSTLLSEASSADDVRLDVRRKTQMLSLRLVPALIDFSRVRDLPHAYMLDDTTGYLHIPSFKSSGVAQRVHNLIAELQEQGSQSLILDLRDNPGGRLGELGLVLGAFIDGPWIEAVSRGSTVWRSSFELRGEQGLNQLIRADGTILASDGLTQAAMFQGPLAVIVSRFNSSAGELAALVLQDLGRATIIGEATSGNVEAVQGFDLPDGSLVYVAVANLQGVTGTSYVAGLRPDIEVGDTLQDLGRGFDASVAEALRSLKDLPFTPGKLF